MNNNIQQQAEELIKLFDNIPRYAKKAIDEIIKSNPTKTYYRKSEWVGEESAEVTISNVEHWQQVKEYLETKI